MSDTVKTLSVVAGLGAVLLLAIVSVVQATMDDLLDEEQVKAAVNDQTAEIDDASDADEKQSKIRRLKRTLDRRKQPTKLDEGAAEQMRDSFNKLDPKGQAFWIMVMMPDTFAKWTKKFFEDNPDAEVRGKKIEEMASNMKEGFDKLPKSELLDMRTGMETLQGKAYLQSVQTFFNSKLDSDQRSEMEPVMKEVLRQVKTLIQLPRPTKAAVKKKQAEIRAEGGPEGRNSGPPAPKGNQPKK